MSISELKFTQQYRDLEADLDEKAVSDCVAEILQQAQKRLKISTRELAVLDCGCGTGDYSLEIAKHVKSVVAVEPDLAALSKARQKSSHGRDRVDFIHGMVEQVHLPTNLDLAISLTTVEHMPEARKSMEKIIDSLKPGGILYLTAPNKLWPLECHYRLLFLSYLPLPLANFYLRITGKGISFEDCSYSRTYWGMQRLFNGLNVDVQFVLPSTTSAYIGAGQNGFWGNLLKRVGIRLIQQIPAFWAISKGFIMVIQKKA